VQQPAIQQYSFTRKQLESISEKKGSPFRPGTICGASVRYIFPGDLAPHPDTFVTLYDSGIFRVHDSDTWSELYVWNKHDGAVNLAASNFWNGKAAVFTTQSKIEVLDLADKSVKSVKVSAPGLTDHQEAVGLMHNTLHAAVATTDHVGLIDLETGRAIRNIKNDYASSHCLKAVPNCPGLAIQLDVQGKIKVWDFNSNSTGPAKVIPGVGMYAHGLYFNPTNPNQFICGSNAQPLRIFDFSQGKASQSVDIVEGEFVREYAIYGNAIMILAEVSGVGTKASLRLLENPNEELNSFTCSSYGQAMECGYITPKSAVAICSGCVVEFQFPH